jgi:Arc/MetJ family transcription regulator
MNEVAARLDQEALRQVAELFGTTTRIDTINAALREVIGAHAHRRFMAYLAHGDIGNPEIMKGCRRP